MRLDTYHTSTRRRPAQRPFKIERRHTSSTHKPFLSNSSDGFQRPIIFVAHSLGGIILKQVRCRPRTSGSRTDAYKSIGICNTQGYQSKTAFRDILVSTHAIVFFGTPHSGTNGVELLRFMNRLASVFMKRNDTILKHLKANSPELDNIQKDYLSASENIGAKFFYEEYATPIVGGRREMVGTDDGQFHNTEASLRLSRVIPPPWLEQMMRLSTPIIVRWSKSRKRARKPLRRFCSTSKSG